MFGIQFRDWTEREDEYKKEDIEKSFSGEREKGNSC